jgi:glycosyltransferase involved in cell wall biosynthesis
MTDIASVAQPDISVVVPCFNEVENVAPIAGAIIAELERARVSFEIIFIDNASTDNTVAAIRALCADDPRIRLIVNTRNFGQMRSPTHAIYAARGRAVIGMCADFQDPPALLGTFIARWRDGVEIILGVRTDERDSPLLNAFCTAFYTLGRWLGDTPLIPNATGFGLYDQKVVRALAQLNEPEPFFRGMLVESGFRLETIPYNRPVRARGLSKNSVFTLIDFALSGFAAAPKTLLRLPLLVAVIAGLAVLLALLGAMLALFTGGSVSFWMIVAAFEAQFALLFAFVGLIGDQVRLVSARTRGTPLVTERERVNFLDGH